MGFAKGDENVEILFMKALEIKCRFFANLTSKNEIND